MKRICAFAPLRASTQVDWAHFGKLTIGRAERPLMAFVLVLSYSRYPFVRFYLGASLANLIRGHVEAFSVLGGTAKVLLYDNMKSVVLERRGDAIRFHPTLLELAAHYRFEPRPVAPARGNEKGRVERLIRFVRGSFFQARRFRDLDDLNDQADEWCNTAPLTALPRGPPTHRRRGLAEERAHLIALTDNPFPARSASRSQPPRAPTYGSMGTIIHPPPPRRPLPHRLGHAPDRAHPRRRHRARHPSALVRPGPASRRPRTHRSARAPQALRPRAPRHRPPPHAAPSAKALFAAAAERHHHLGVLARGLIELLNAHGPVALERAIAAALQSDAAYLGGVRHFIDQHRKESDKPPPLALDLPDDPRLRTLSVRPHDLADYDRLHDESDSADEEQSRDDDNEHDNSD